MATTCSIRITTLVAMGLIGGCALASAQTCPTSPNYSPDFTANQNCLTLNSATGTPPTFGAPQTAQSSVSTVLRLTPPVTGLANSAWFNTPQTVTTGFSTTFAFQIGHPSTYNADGIAFVIQNSPAVGGNPPTGGLNALGGGGCGIGFGGSDCVDGTGGIPQSVAIEFNTFFNSGADPNANDVAIQSCANGGPNSVSDVPPPTGCNVAINDLTTTTINLADGNVHSVTITYTPSSLSNCGTGNQTCSRLYVIVDGTELFNGGALFDMSSITSGGTTAYVGFTAGTGGGDDEQDILNWIFQTSSPTQSGTVVPAQNGPTTFTYNGGFAINEPTSGYDFNAQETTSTQAVQMVVTSVSKSQADCNALVRMNPAFQNATCFVYQNGGGPSQDSAVMFEVTCPAVGSCGSNSPFFADLGSNFSFSCSENSPLQCGPPENPTLSFGLPNLTSSNGLPSVGFLKGEGGDPSHPCTPDPNAPFLFASNQIESFHLGDTSGGAKGGSGGTTSCWVMTYTTQNETPNITITQPVSGNYTLNQSDSSTVANYTCSAVNAGASSATGPYLTVPNALPVSGCTSGTVPTGSHFDTSTPGTHTFTVQVQDSATNTNSQTVTYTVGLAPTVSGPSAATFQVGAANTVTFTATGSPVPTISETGALPSGVTFVDNHNGSASLSGTATGTGVFPMLITAQNGVGPASTLPFTLTVAASAPAAGKCNGIYNGTFKGNLTVSAGQSCTFIGGGVTGNVTENGGAFSATNAALGGNVVVTGGAFSIGPAVSVKGNVSVVIPGKSTNPSQVCGATVGGNLQVLGSQTPVNIGSTSASCQGNTITGTVTVSANLAATSISNNTIGGNLLDLANLKPTQVFSNHVHGILNCQADASITGGGNTAASKQGQCSRF